MGQADGITRANLAERTVSYLRRGKPWQPDIILARGDTGKRVVKDYRARPFLYRVGVGLISVWRENRMYARLAGLPGIPKGYGAIDRDALVVEFVEGETAAQFGPGQIPAPFFEELDRVVEGIHQRGVVLGDLRNRRNVMITPDFRPVLIDLCTAFERGAWWNLPGRVLHRVFYQDDLMGLLKIKRRLAPELLSPEEAERLSRGLFLERPVVRIRNVVVRCMKWLVTKKNR